MTFKEANPTLVSSCKSPKFLIAKLYCWGKSIVLAFAGKNWYDRDFLKQDPKWVAQFQTGAGRS